MHREQYLRRKQLAVYWHNKASDLLGSAGVLWASMGDPRFEDVPEELGLGRGFSFGVACWPVYQMLCGMSLELLLKATIVEQGKAPQATHDLVELSEQAAVSFTAEEQDVLRLLTGSIIWEGRYPVPKTEKSFTEDAELRLKVLFDEVQIGKLMARKQNDSLSWDGYQSLWRKASAAYARASSQRTHTDT